MFRYYNKDYYRNRWSQLINKIKNTNNSHENWIEQMRAEGKLTGMPPDIGYRRGKRKEEE